MARLTWALSLAAVSAATALAGAQTPAARLPASVLDVTPPSARVTGRPGEMTLQQRPCRTLRLQDVRRRIVDVAVQEWGYFGFRVVDWTDIAAAREQRARDAQARGSGADQPSAARRRSRLGPEEASRVAPSIAGYWAVTPEGSWIVARQNDDWKGADGVGARWNAPWSAAFISWVMCEAGLGATGQFQRAIAHHAYIDQAIRARDGRAAQAAFAAYDMGEAPIAPGDLLCSARRPVYRTLAERRRQAGVGARTHCDVVVKVDEPRERILVVGGNVRGVVALKLLRAQRQPDKPLRVVDPDEDERPIFAHLRLRAEPIAPDALDTSATLKAAACASGADALAAVAPAVAKLVVASC
jgi:hypothetical protein